MRKITITGELNEETSDDELDTLYDLLPQVGITEIQIDINDDDDFILDILAERQKRNDEFCEMQCRTCTNNLYAGTDCVYCQKELEVDKDTGIICVNYEKIV